MGIEAAILGASAISAIGGAMSSSDGQSQSSSNSPWSYQAPYLHEGFKRADSAWYDANNLGRYKGDFVAGGNDNLTGGWNRMGNWSNTAEAAGAGLTNSGWSGVANFGNVTGNANAIYDRAMSDPTGRTIAAAGAYANNPYADGVIDASLRDVNRNLQTGIAQNNASAVGSGNMNSTRAGVTEALLTNAAQDRAADIASGVRGNLFNTGLGLANQQNTTGMSAALAANNQSLGATKVGADLITGGLAAQNAGIQGQLDVGNQQRALAQAELDNAIQGNEYARTADMDLAARYMKIVGGQQFGNNVESTTFQNRNPIAAGVQGGLGAGAQMFGLARMAGYDPFGGWGSAPLKSANLDPFTIGGLW